MEILHLSLIRGYNTELNAAYSALQRHLKEALYKGVPEAEKPIGDFSPSITAKEISLMCTSVQGDNVIFSSGRTLPLAEIVKMAEVANLKVTVAPDAVSIP